MARFHRSGVGVDMRNAPDLGSFDSIFLLLVAAVALIMKAPCVWTETIDPANSGEQFAWSENISWLNAEPLGNGGPGVAVIVDHLEGWLWSENIGWVSLSCANTNSCDQVDFGIETDGNGNLSGFAWSENAGWIIFSCGSTGSCGTVSYGVTISPSTGEFNGWAWSENVGWISFSCVNTNSCATVEYRVRTARSSSNDAIFFDGFESGNLVAWSRTVQ